MAADLPDQPAAGGGRGCGRRAACPSRATRRRGGSGSTAPGAVLTALGLAGVTYALTEGPQRRLGRARRRWRSGLGGRRSRWSRFVVVEARGRHPMLPLDLFRSGLFTAANAMTFVVYGALGAALFLLPIQLQQVAGYSPIQAGSALIPMTIVMLLLSSRRRAPVAAHRAAHPDERRPDRRGRSGSRCCTRVGPGRRLRHRRPARRCWCSPSGMSITVAPLNVTVLGAAGRRRGRASRRRSTTPSPGWPGLLAVAVIPVAAGISGDDYLVPDVVRRGLSHRHPDVRGALRPRRDPRRDHRPPRARAAGRAAAGDPDALLPQRAAARDPRRGSAGAPRLAR